MENPLELWRQATSNPKWKTLPENEKKALRESFLSKYKDAPEDVRVGLMVTSASSIDEIFNLPEFEQTDDDTKKKYLKGYIYASKGSIGKGLDILSEGALKKYKATAYMAGARRYTLGAKQIYQRTISPFSTKEDIAKTQEEIAANERIAQRSPGRALAGEVTMNVAAPLALARAAPAAATAAIAARTAPLVSKIAKLPWLAKLGLGATAVGTETAITSPVEIKGGTEEEQSSAFWREKSSQFGVGTLTAGLVQTPFVPAIRQRVGETGRWLYGFVSEGGRRGDIADDVLRRVKDRFPDLSEKEITKQLTSLSSQVKKIKDTEAATKIPELLGKNEVGLTLQTMQGENPIPDLKSFIVDNFSQKAVKEASKLKAEKPAIENISSSFWNKYIKPNVVKTKTETDEAIENIKKTFTNDATRLYRTLTPEKVDITKAQLRNRTLDFLKRSDIQAQRVTLKSNPAIKNILDKPKDKGVPVRLTAKDLQEYIQQSFESLDGVGGNQTKAFVDDVLRPALGKENSALVDKVYESYLQMSAAKTAAETTVKAEGARALQAISARNPLIGAIAKTKNENAAEVPKTVIELFRNKKVLPAHIDELAPEEVSSIGALVLSDISDKFNKAVLPEDKINVLGEFLQGYGGESKDAMLRMFSKDKEASTILQKLYSLAEGADLRARNVLPAAEQGTGGALFKTVTAEASQARSLSISNLVNIVQSIQRKTRKLLLESSIDKQEVLKLLSKTKDIQEGRIAYKDLWNKGQGIRGYIDRGLKGTLETGGTSVVAGEEQPVQPPAPEQAPPTRENLTNAVDSGTIEETLSSVNINPKFVQVVYDIAGIESNFNPDTDLKNPNSSAQGPFQITEGTWDYITKSQVTKEDGTKVAGLGLETALGRPLDKNSTADHALVAAAYMRKNYEGLTEAGIKGTESNLYVAHAWGLNGAKKLFKYRGKNVAIEDIMSMDAIKGHPKFAKPGMTVDQVLQNTIKYFKERRDNKGKSALIEAVNENVS